MATKPNKKSGASLAPITRGDLRSAASNKSTALATLPEGFQDAGGFQAPAGAIVKTMSPMLKPADFPVGKVLVGKFLKIFQTIPGKNDDGSDKVGEGVEIVPEGSPVGVALPCVATLRQGLELVGRGKDATSQFLGRTVAIQKLEKRLPSKKGQDAWHFLVAIYPEEKI